MEFAAGYFHVKHVHSSLRIGLKCNFLVLMEGGGTEIQLGDTLKRKFAFSMTFKEKPCAQLTF